jgi:hypothetical protein
MNQQLISQIYDKVFYDNEEISKANINLVGVSLDIYADSENESEMKDEIAPKQTPTTKSSHKTQKKPRKSHHTSSWIPEPHQVKKTTIKSIFHVFLNI